MTNTFAKSTAVPQQAAMLTYDIPSSVKMPNPSHLLGALGMFRVNYSVWVGTLTAISRVPIEKWNARGVSTNVVRFEKEEWERVRALAERSLAQDLEGLREYLQKNVARAQGLFAQAEAEQSVKLTGKARGTLAAVLREAERRVRVAEASLLMFDLCNSRDDLLTAFRDTYAAAHAAHAAQAWLRKSKSGKQVAFEQLTLDEAEDTTAATTEEPEPAIEDALMFLSGSDLKEVEL
jgi:hypothetical protein